MLLISDQGSGLGNRIKSLVSLFRFLPVEEHENIRFSWMRNWIDCNQIDHGSARIEAFDDIFDSPLQSLEMTHTEAVALAKQEKALLWREWRWGRTENYDLKFNESPLDYQQSIIALLRKYFQPSARVKEIVDERWKTVKHCQVGMFIRTGTNQKQEYRCKFHRLEDYKIDPDITYYVVSDTPRVWQYYRAFPNVVCFLDDNYMYGGWDYHYANMLLLSRCQQLVLPRFSTFAQVVNAIACFSKPLTLMNNMKRRAYRTEDNPVIFRRSVKECRQLLSR